MAFGQGYTPRESIKLTPGEYEAGIIGARYEQTKNGTPYLAVYVQIKGHPGAKPNCLTFYDRPYAGQKEMGCAACPRSPIRNSPTSTRL